MSEDLRELYQDIILDHNKRPRNFRDAADATHRADGHNPLCGDCVTVFLTVDGERVVDAAFQGQGCAISTASASLMTEAIIGKSVDEARDLFHRIHESLTADQPPCEDFGAIEALLGVKEFPMRVKCATLAWHAMEAALAHTNEPVTTEA